MKTLNDYIIKTMFPECEMYDIFFDFKHDKKLTKNQIDYIMYRIKFPDAMATSVLYYIKRCRLSMSLSHIERALLLNPDMLELFI